MGFQKGQAHAGMGIGWCGMVWLYTPKIPQRCCPVLEKGGDNRRMVFQKFGMDKTDQKICPEMP